MLINASDPRKTSLSHRMCIDHLTIGAIARNSPRLAAPDGVAALAVSTRPFAVQPTAARGAVDGSHGSSGAQTRLGIA
jgi:hypothetical protein